MNKEERRRDLGHIERLESAVDSAREALRQSQHNYLMALGFTCKKGTYVDDYIYQEFVLYGISRALEYAEEHIK